MKKVAVLGMGAMGSRMAGRLIDAGLAVMVWNRTPARAQALIERGARWAPTPAAAVSGVDAALSMVRDDAASRDVWLDPDVGALGALPVGAVAVECSTLSLAYVQELAVQVRSAGRAFVDAPLAGSRPQADAGQLIFLAGGDAADVERVRPLLAPLAGAVHHAGDAGAGATVKLMVNALFGAQLAVVAELIGFSRRAGMDAQRAMDIVASTPVCSPAAKAGAAAMLAGNWLPAFPIDLVEKDFGLVERSAGGVGAPVPMCSAARAIYARALDAGFGVDNITGIVQLYDGAP